jgi:hypothetical protein
MRVSFHSSHVEGDFSSGRLTVRFALEDDVRGVTHAGEFFFDVPPDFHVHSDLVAAALMAVMRRGCGDVRFNFPVSAHCAATLPLFHRCGEVTPVDPDLEPRRPGRYLGVSFSGGLDSLAVLTMLREIGEEVKVITAEYAGFHREAVGYAGYARDVSCHTNFRRVVGDRGRRFDAAVPLLFADYADLGSFATGHQFGGVPGLWVDPRTGPREVVWQAPVSDAGGLTEVHIARSLRTAGLLRYIVSAAPEQVERGFHATSAPGTQKYLAKGLMLRHIYQEMDVPIPPFLRNLAYSHRTAGMTTERIIHLSTIWEWRYLRHTSARRVDPRIILGDWSALEPLSLDFFWKYCPLSAELIPAAFRERLLATLRAHGIAPYSAQDYDELEAVRQCVLAINAPGSVTFG